MDARDVADGWDGHGRALYSLPTSYSFSGELSSRFFVSTSTSTRKSHPPPKNTAVNTRRLIPSSPTSWSRVDHYS